MNTSLHIHKIFPVESSYIEKLERRMGLEFPEIYKKRMMEENGGEIKTAGQIWQLFPFFDESDIHRMIYTCDHIGISTIFARKWVHFPQGAVAIGSNSLGDMLILLPEKHHPYRLAESVYIWNRQKGEVVELAKDIHMSIMVEGLRD